MERHTSIRYRENREPVKEDYGEILGVPVNEKYSALVYAKLEELEKIHRGGFNSQRGIYAINITTEDGIKKTFAKKEIVKPNEFKKMLIFIFPFRITQKNFNKKDILAEKELAYKTINKFNILKKIKAKTFDDMFIYKGRFIITTLINDEDNIAVASNCFGMELPSCNTGGESIDARKYKNKLEIKDATGFVKGVFKEMKSLAKKGGLCGRDSLFFLMPRIMTDNKEGLEIKSLIGDLDHFRYIPGSTKVVERGFIDDLERFVKYFVKKELQQEYLGMIRTERYKLAEE